MPAVAVWFSCGAASAVAAKLAVERFSNVRVVYNPVIEEHEDNLRFLKDVESWIGCEIEIASNPNFPNASAVEVWDKKRFMSSPYGAPCTSLLKKKAREHWEKMNVVDFHILGFTSEEKSRHERCVLTERSNVIPILIERGLTKQDCLEFIIEAGIKPPEIYRLGYPNANCIGCVKANSPTYWNHVRNVHPIIFQERAIQSRSLGARLVRVKGQRMFLDQLDPTARGRPLKSLTYECGVFCSEEE